MEVEEMNNQAKKELYSQLVEIEEYLEYLSKKEKVLQNLLETNKEENNFTKIPTKEDFDKMELKDCLKYIFDYRDKYTVDLKNITIRIELPDMNLQGENLEDVFLSKFVCAKCKIEEIDGKKTCLIERKTKVNLKDTNVNIHLGEISPNIHITQEELSYGIDFTDCDFRGCNVMGILPEDGKCIDKISSVYPIKVKGLEKLDSRYVERRKIAKTKSPEAINLAKRAYERLMQEKELKGLRGKKDIGIDFTDYNLSNLNYRQIVYLLDEIAEDRAK